MCEKDELIIAAFLMEGLHDAGCNNVLDAWDCGCVELIDEVTDYVPFIKLMCDTGEKIGEGFPGVFDYEVTSPFGKWFGLYIFDYRNAPCIQDRLDKIEELATNFFLRGAETWAVTTDFSVLKEMDEVAAANIREAMKKGRAAYAGAY